MTVFLDHNATTPMDEVVLEAMLPYLRDQFGNPSSIHTLGHQARNAIGEAREKVAALVGAHPSQVIFTSGGTEANNAALKGFAWRNGSGSFAVSAVEHPSVMQPARSLQRHGWQLQTVAVDSEGAVKAESIPALAKTPNLLSLMWANNETGVINPVESLAQHAREQGVVVHSDAVQALGKLPLNFASSAVQLMSLSAHKIYGPKGAGALVVDKAVDLEPLLHGGGQERERRGGTENIAAIVGFGVAAERTASELVQRAGHSCTLRDRFEQRLLEMMPDAVIFGSGAERLPNTSFIALPGIEGETLITALDRQGIAISSGSACGSDKKEPSPVLAAMGIDSDTARCAVRISFGQGNSDSDVDRLIDALQGQLQQMRGMAALGWD